MARYSFAVVAGGLALGCASTPAPPSRPVAPMAGPALSIPAGLSPDEQARHVLNRLAFGPRPGEVERVTRMGVGRWLADQLEPAQIPDSACDRMLAGLETQRKTAPELIADHPLPQEVQMLVQRASSDGKGQTQQDSATIRRFQQQQSALNNETVAAKTLRAVNSERQLLEVMTDFWENHFSV